VVNFLTFETVDTYFCVPQESIDRAK